MPSEEILKIWEAIGIIARNGLQDARIRTSIVTYMEHQQDRIEALEAKVEKLQPLTTRRPSHTLLDDLLHPEGSDTTWHEGHIESKPGPMYEPHGPHDFAQDYHGFKVGDRVSVGYSPKADGVISRIDDQIWVVWDICQPFSLNPNQHPRSYEARALVKR